MAVPHKHPRRVKTIIIDTENTQIQWLDAAVWPPLGAEITVPRLGALSQQLVVVDVRLELAADDDEDEALAVIIVQVDEALAP